MKKTILAVLMILLFGVSVAMAAELKLGDTAAGFKLKDPKGVEYSLDSPQYKGKVVVVFYADPGSKDLNNDLQNALKAARESGKIDKTFYEGLGVVNVKDSILPNFVLRSIIKSKQEETKAVILIDPDYAGPDEKNIEHHHAGQAENLPLHLQRQSPHGGHRQGDCADSGVSGKIKAAS
jgi:predicted transcriptional regulator